MSRGPDCLVTTFGNRPRPLPTSRGLSLAGAGKGSCSLHRRERTLPRLPSSRGGFGESTGSHRGSPASCVPRRSMWTSDHGLARPRPPRTTLVGVYRAKGRLPGSSSNGFLTSPLAGQLTSSTS